MEVLQLRKEKEKKNISNPFSSYKNRGEQTATAMEANLSDLESKLDALLAAFEQLEDEKGGKKEGGAPEQKSKPEEKWKKKKMGNLILFLFVLFLGVFLLCLCLSLFLWVVYLCSLAIQGS